MNASYYAMAGQARTAEILGHRAQAHQLWLQAAGLAQKPDNASWAECRADFCIKSRFAPAAESEK